MELRHVRYFVALADSLNFGRAAAHLRIAQPSLSQQIRQLESELQARLFVRATRRVQLTEAGRLSVAEARAVLAHPDRAAVVARRRVPAAASVAADPADGSLLAPGWGFTAHRRLCSVHPVAMARRMSAIRRAEAIEVFSRI
jgi:DNA-binding transcriptional LysR family regulator